MAAEHLERLGTRIRERRDELGLSRGEVARRMPGKTNENAIYRWEKGQHAPNPDTLEALARVLEVDTSFFYVGQREAGPTPDLTATFNGTMPDELRAEVAELHRKLDELLAKVELLGSAIGALSAAAEEPDQAPATKPAARPRRTRRRATG